MSSKSDASSGGSHNVGGRLRAAREDKNIALREIAATTKISISLLEALEQNDVARLPGGIFTRAFVRSYATEVGLDPEQTMWDFMAQVSTEGPSDKAPSEPLRMPEHDLFQSQRRMVGTILALAGVGLPLAGMLLFFGMREASGPTDEPEEVVATAPVVRPVSPPRDPGGVPPPVSLPVEESLAIRLSPTGECWVSLMVDGELKFARVLSAGEEELYEAKDEIVLTIGDAGAFSFSLNQQTGRPLGGAGEVVTARINLDNFQNYLAP
ncbi:MAG: RodZ domain-containing protein [Acidobacteriota bacterium]|nr:RodZ domain-containing protein [Acidobacteriota bacterium]